jgi:PDZ domain-containing secreted protein
MLLQDIGIMPDSAVEVLYAVWSMSKWRNEYYLNEIPNAETIAAINDTDYNSYDSFEDLMKHIDEMEDDDEEL